MQVLWTPEHAASPSPSRSPSHQPYLPTAPAPPRPSVPLSHSEIILRPYQFCNLTEVVVRAGDDAASLARKVRLAAVLGTFQATLTSFPYLREVSTLGGGSGWGRGDRLLHSHAVPLVVYSLAGDRLPTNPSHARLPVPWPACVQELLKPCSAVQYQWSWNSV